MPGTDGSPYTVAFIRNGKTPTWLEFSGVEPSRLNELYFNLTFWNGERFAHALHLMKKQLVPIAERISRQIAVQVGVKVAAQVESERRAALGAVVLAVARAL